MSTANQNPPPERGPLGSSAWVILLGALVLCITVAEAVLLELGATFFTGGFNYPNLDTPAQIGGFFLASLTMDAFLVLAIWLVAIPIFRRFAYGPLSCFVFTAVLSLGLPAVADLLRYRLFAVLGRGVSLENLFELGGGSASVMATEVTLQLRGVVGFAILALAAIPLLAWGARRVAHRWPAVTEWVTPTPRLPFVAAACALAGLAGSIVFWLPGDSAERVRRGILAKPSGILLVDLIRFSSDVDRDGFGLLSRPADHAPFDASLHPFAVDRPSNQVDENGIAGDHPAGFAPIHEPPGPGGEVGELSRPLLVVFLESFRTDLLGARYEGQEITPFLNRLAREGAASQRAFANTPSTVPSRAQLFRGDIEWQRAGETWIDDFKDEGYTVAHFSGQDDSLNDSPSYLGTARADVFYDARDDIDLRTSRTANPMSLQVSWKTLGRRVKEFLANYDSEIPLFLYVNIVDTHFPYHHDEIDNLLGIDPIDRSDISRDRAEQIRSTYANTAANVDHAVEELVETWWERMGRDSAIVITADHSQSFYENGVLGHGQFLDESHTRVPLILWGLGGEWPEPVSLADVRSLVRENLSQTGESPARFVPDPDRWIFQYAYSLDGPRRIQLRGLDRSVAYTFAENESQLQGSFDDLREPGEDEAAFEKRMTDWLIRNWEAYQLRANDPARRD
ncbi:MAG: sulfatase-like hydrolase/transferase [Myxococcota bacterium]|nr:sulfatase-like hydrolase/transferase [Myxococcota bacterium]